MSLLVDSSVWIDHLRKSDPALKQALLQGDVLCHPHIIGEIALGNLNNRRTLLSLLQDLPSVTPASNDEVLALIELRALHGRGIGFVDCHLLASLLLSPDAELWTRDKRLAHVAATLKSVH